jgi:hypothetical protein
MKGGGEMPYDRKKAPPRMQAPRIRIPAMNEAYQRLRALRGAAPHANDLPTRPAKAQGRRSGRG